MNMYVLCNGLGMLLFYSLIQQFASSKEERQRILKALEKAKLPHNIKDTIQPADFTFQSFLTFYISVCERLELTEIYKNM